MCMQNLMYPYIGCANDQSSGKVALRHKILFHLSKNIRCVHACLPAFTIALDHISKICELVKMHPCNS